jgi:hypothetical protein
MRRWKDLPYSWISRISIVKMAILLKAVYRFNAIPIKIPIPFFTETERSILKFTWKHKRPLINKAILSRKHNAGGTTTLTSNYTTESYQQKQHGTGNRHIDQWNRRSRNKPKQVLLSDS